MFKGEESVVIAPLASEEETFDHIEEALQALGRARVSGRGNIDISPRGTLEGSFSKTTLRGSVRERKNGDYEVSVWYDCSLNGAGWAVCILGFIFLLFGPLIIFAPANLKNEVSRRVRSALEDIEDGGESRGRRRR